MTHEQKLERIQGLYPRVRWRCEDCRESGEIRISPSSGTTSFLNWVRARHEDASTHCAGQRLRVIVPTKPVPNRRTQRERIRKLARELRVKLF